MSNFEIGVRTILRMDIRYDVEKRGFRLQNLLIDYVIKSTREEIIGEDGECTPDYGELLDTLIARIMPIGHRPHVKESFKYARVVNEPGRVFESMREEGEKQQTIKNYLEVYKVRPESTAGSAYLTRRQEHAEQRDHPTRNGRERTRNRPDGIW